MFDNAMPPFGESLFMDDLSKRITTPSWIQWLSNLGSVVDYSSKSVVVGWSAFTAKSIRYAQHGKIVTVWFYIVGTSNATGVSFTVPFVIANGAAFSNTCRAIDNTSTTAVGLAIPHIGDGVVNVYASIAGAAWTNSGTKYAIGEVSFQVK
jgi:hypothetical protein